MSGNGLIERFNSMEYNINGEKSKLVGRVIALVPHLGRRVVNEDTFLCSRI